MTLVAELQSVSFRLHASSWTTWALTKPVDTALETNGSHFETYSTDIRPELCLLRWQRHGRFSRGKELREAGKKQEGGRASHSAHLQRFSTGTAGCIPCCHTGLCLSARLRLVLVQPHSLGRCWDWNHCHLTLLQSWSSSIIFPT